MAHVGAGEHHAVRMDRIRGIRHQHHITGTERRERQMRETFLGADRGDDFALGIKVNVLALLVPARHRTTQARNALRYRIAMRMHAFRSEDHTSELSSLMRISYAVYCLEKNKFTLKQ